MKTDIRHEHVFFSRFPLPSFCLKAVEPGWIVIEDVRLGRGAEVFALLQFARGVALAISVRHVGPHDDLSLAHQLHDLYMQPASKKNRAEVREASGLLT